MDFDGLSHLMNASEKLEMGIAELYSLFGKALPEDRTFWEQLGFEEKNHADLIASIHETFIPLGEEFPTSILAWTRTEVDRANQIVTDYLAAFAEAAPDREKIFNTALDLELAAGEIHFQCFMKKPLKTYWRRCSSSSTRRTRTIASESTPICNSMALQ